MYYLVRPAVNIKGYLLVAVHDRTTSKDNHETTLGTYKSKRAAITTGRLLAGWRFPVLVEV